MKITLIQAGGFLPVMKKASKECDWNDGDLEELEQVAKPEAKVGKPDKIDYIISSDKKTFSIDWEKVPERFKATLELLRYNLQVQKF